MFRENLKSFIIFICGDHVLYFIRLTVKGITFLNSLLQKYFWLYYFEDINLQHSSKIILNGLQICSVFVYL